MGTCNSSWRTHLSSSALCERPVAEAVDQGLVQGQGPQGPAGGRSLPLPVLLRASRDVSGHVEEAQPVPVLAEVDGEDQDAAEASLTSFLGDQGPLLHDDACFLPIGLSTHVGDYYPLPLQLRS